MAFTLQAIVGSATVNLTNGAPFKLLSATGMGGAPVRRVTARGPAQQGDTDLGYRLQAREIELQIGFAATTDVALDGCRDTLTSVFKPTASTPVQLRVMRDDAEVRQIDCYTVGVLRIDLVPEHRPGHYHVATVQLRASNPAWYSVTPGTITVQGSASPDTEWWLAGGAIGSANVLMYGTAPAQGEAWSYAGTVTDAYTLALHMPYVSVSDNIGKYAFLVVNDAEPQNSLSWRMGTTYFGSERILLGNDGLSEATGNVTGTATYFVSVNTSSIRPTRVTVYQDSELVASNSLFASYAITGTARTWRASALGSTDSYWPEEIIRYALYGTSVPQELLHRYMDEQIGDDLTPLFSVPYTGDLAEYPVIRITGPIDSPSITNESTGDALDFGTIAIGSAVVYSIDTRYGYKTVTAGTVDKRSELTADSDLSTWSLVPATSGVNVLRLGGSAIGPTTKIEVVYYNRYLSF